MVVHSLYTYEENFGNCFGYLALGNYCVTYQLFPNTSSCTLHPYVFVITGLLFALFVLPMFLLLRFCSVVMFFVLFILCNFSVLYNVVLLSQIHFMVFLPHFCCLTFCSLFSRFCVYCITFCCIVDPGNPNILSVMYLLKLCITYCVPFINFISICAYLLRALHYHFH